MAAKIILIEIEAESLEDAENLLREILADRIGDEARAYVHIGKNLYRYEWRDLEPVKWQVKYKKGGK
jgi:hypothetical protein